MPRMPDTSALDYINVCVSLFIRALLLYVMRCFAHCPHLISL